MPQRFFDHLYTLGNRLDWQDCLLLGASAYLLAFLYLTVARSRR